MDNQEIINLCTDPFETVLLLGRLGESLTDTLLSWLYLTSIFLTGEIMSTTGSEKSLLMREENAKEERSNSSPQLSEKFSFTIWPDGPDFRYQSSGEWHVSLGSGKESLRGEAGEEYPYFIYVPQGEEGEVKEEEEGEKEEEYEIYKEGRRKAEKGKPTGSQDTKNKSIFVHSFPSQFPDVTKIRKSAFGSIFLKTAAEGAEELALLRSITDNSYLLLCSLLDSFERIIADSNTDAERRRFTVYFKESLQRTLEAHGISKTYSDGSVRWDIYPITQGYLFSIYLHDRLHQTRNFSKVEERILTGPMREVKLPTSWPTKSIWSGYWDSLGMTSNGIYSMPHGVTYFGKMQDGMFHDTNATLTYPNRFKAFNCVFEKGKLLSCQFQFPDMLVYEDDWKYCKFPDRRFWSEVQNGLKSAKAAQKTQIHPPRTIPPGCYDTGDGFYNPKTLMLESPHGKLLRVPVCEEDRWIKKYCRKGFFEYADFRPDLFENWFNYDQDLINSILNQQAAYRAGKITYGDLQQFYADLDLLPPFSPFKKRKTSAEVELEEFMKSIPEPEFLRSRHIRKFEGHKIHTSLKESSEKICGKSKSSIRTTSELTEKTGGSKIGFPSSNLKWNVSDSEFETEKRKIPEKYLAYRPLLKFPFQPRYRNIKRTKCTPRKSSSSSSGEIVIPAEGADDYIQEIKKKNDQKYMKNLILEMITSFLEKERSRHRQRYIWGQKISSKTRGDTDNESLKVLKKLFDSIPDKDEFCDSDPKKTCDFKEFAKDKHNMLKYWGKRILLLDIDEEPKEEDKPKIEKLDLIVNADAELLFAPFLHKDK